MSLYSYESFKLIKEYREARRDKEKRRMIKESPARTEEEVAALCEYMAEKISHIKYTPCSVTAKGLPWIEAGDTIDVLTKKGGFESIILRRTLSGIQGLVDDIEAKGKE